MFTYFKNRRDLKEKATALYQVAVAQSRQPEFYADYAVPDSMDGRFEMVCLHCYLLMRRLQAAGEKKLSQKLFDVFFKTMDFTLREMGIGDLGVPKHMKRMMQGFNGRAHAYESALKANNIDALKLALVTNVYGTVEKPPAFIIDSMADYVVACAQLSGTKFAPLMTMQEKKSA